MILIGLSFVVTVLYYFMKLDIYRDNLCIDLNRSVKVKNTIAFQRREKNS